MTAPLIINFCYNIVSQGYSSEGVDLSTYYIFNQDTKINIIIEIGHCSLNISLSKLITN